jgi:hypothetical protein
MSTEIFIRPGRAGTLETLQLIEQLGRKGAPMIPFLLLGIHPSRWDGMIRPRWQYEMRRSVDGKEAQQTFRSIDQQLFLFRKTGHMAGDCAECAVVVVAVAIATGRPYEILAMRPPDELVFRHVFVEVEGYRIDPTAPTDADYTGWERLTYP